MEKFNADNCYYVVNAEFKNIEGNRNLKPRHIERIKDAMLDGESLPPILVDSDTKYIIDGQHRYAAAFELWEEGVPYKLLVCEYNSGDPLLEAIKFNNTQLKWELGTYVKAYAADHNNPERAQVYSKFKNWVESLGLQNHYDVAGTLVRLKTSSIIKDGNLYISNEDYEGAELYLKLFAGTVAMSRKEAIKATRQFLSMHPRANEKIIRCIRETTLRPMGTAQKDFISLYQRITKLYY